MKRIKPSLCIGLADIKAKLTWSFDCHSIVYVTRGLAGAWFTMHNYHNWLDRGRLVSSKEAWSQVHQTKVCCDKINKILLCPLIKFKKRKAKNIIEMSLTKVFLSSNISGCDCIVAFQTSIAVNTQTSILNRFEIWLQFQKTTFILNTPG